MKPGWMAAMTLLAAGSAVSRTLDCAPRLTAWLENGMLSDRNLLGVAQGTATRIFATIGVKLVWRVGAPVAVRPCGFHVGIVLEEEAPGHLGAEALGYTTVGQADTTIHIFYKRVLRAYNRGLAPAVLGHVFAHEIIHVLENVARHSDSGVLKARWTTSDFADMLARPLAVAPVDAELVLDRLGIRKGEAL